MAAAWAQAAARSPGDSCLPCKGYARPADLPVPPLAPTPCSFSDFVQSPSGLQYRDFKEGSGPAPREGQTCVVDWSGVTIGYYGGGGRRAGVMRVTIVLAVAQGEAWSASSGPAGSPASGEPLAARWPA